jgi:cell wall-associated NlpC family hydrolase
MARVVLVVGAALAAIALGLGGCVALVAGAGGTGTAVGAASAGGTGSGPAVPASWEALEQEAAATCPGLDWTVLAAIARVESDSGRSDAPGVSSGANPAGAEGPLQFEPATFAAYATVGPGGVTPPSPYDPVDALYTAARLLCADGAGAAGGLAGAVFDYNHSTAYVDTVLVLSWAIGSDADLATAAATAIAFAAGQLGAPYLWGGTGDGGWDCSGLVQAAYAAAGVTLPRVAQTQFTAGPALVPPTPPLPGDLVFFGGSATDVGHVGLFIGGGLMIDAPHTGAVVRVDPTPTTPGAAFGTEAVVGLTRPWG